MCYPQMMGYFFQQELRLRGPFGRSTRTSLTILFPNCTFAQYPTGGLGIFLWRHRRQMAVSVTPSVLASSSAGVCRNNAASSASEGHTILYALSFRIGADQFGIEPNRFGI